MSKINPVDFQNNIYANDRNFTLVKQRVITFEGRKIQTLTYKDSHSIVWSIGQVALAAILTLVTLGFMLCFQRGRLLWQESLGRFQERVVHQNIPITSAQQTILSNPTPSNNILPAPPNPPSLVPSNPAPSPTSIATPVVQPSDADIKLMQKIKEIIKENPEYEKAVQAWAKGNISLTDQISRLETLRQYAFGTDKWIKHIGTIEGAIPSLPEDIFEICNSHDPSGNALVQNTHVLVLVPAAVTTNGTTTPITLKSIANLPLKTSPFPSATVGSYNYLNAPGHTDVPVTKSHWVLMQKRFLINSVGKTYNQQVEQLKQYSGQMNAEYSPPNAVDVAACCFMTKLHKNETLFMAFSNMPFLYTNCKETVSENKRVVVGAYVPLGLEVGCHTDMDGYGIVGVRTF